jgi:hypothetical protein
MRLSTHWTKHISDEAQKKRFLEALSAAGIGFSRLSQILKDRFREIEGSSLRVSDFEDPSWSHKQAFKLGQQAAIKEVLDLIDFANKD